MPPPRCDHRTQPRKVRGIWGLNHRCRYPAKYRVKSTEPNKVPWGGDTPCGLHVRPYLMDNGDSVRKPWIVLPLEALPMS